MARYKVVDLSPRFLAVDLEKQLLPGSFAHAVHHLLDHDFDLSGFDTRYRNDETGATAYPPGMLLKVILCAYAEGVVSSRGINDCAANTSPSLPSRATVPRTLPRRKSPWGHDNCGLCLRIGRRRGQTLCPSPLPIP